GGIGNGLLQKFRRNIGATGQKKSVNVDDCNGPLQGVANLDLGMFVEKRLEPFLVFLPDPGGKSRHCANVRCRGTCAKRLFLVRCLKKRTAITQSPISSRTYFTGGLP